MIRKGVIKYSVLFLGSVLLSLVYLWIYKDVLGLTLPKTAILRKTNEGLCSELELARRRMESYDAALNDFEARDENTYRLVFGMNSIPESVRESGLGGVNRYLPFEGKNHTSLMSGTIRTADRLLKKAYVQSRSYDEIALQFRVAGDMASCIPAIPPIAPDDRKYRISSRFGYRRDPIRGYSAFHRGVDFAMKAGSPIYVVGDGVVLQVKNEIRGYGNQVLIDHGYGFKTRYAHMKSVYVSEGMHLKRGQQIGTVGNSGKSTGPHLHYEIFYREHAVNPLNYLDLSMPVEQYREMTSDYTEVIPEFTLATRRKRKQ